MKKINLIFALLLSLMGVTQVKAQVTDDFSSYTTTTSGTTLGDNWEIIPGTDGSWASFGSNNDYVHYNEYGEHYVAGNSNSNYSKGVWLVLKKKVTGTVTFTATNGNSSSSFTIYVSKANESGSSYEVTGSAQSYSVPSRTSSAKTYTFEAGNTPTYVAFCLVGTSKNPKLQTVTYTEVTAVEGPGLVVSGDNEGTLNFGLVNPGTPKSLTLSNPGTESITVDITTTGDFTAVSSMTIAADSQETLEIAAPDETATGTVTITPNPAVDGIDPVTINLSAVVKDPNKMFIDFSDGMPDQWETEGVGTYYSDTYAWKATSGYAETSASASYYAGSLTTTEMEFEDGETFLFKAQKNGTSSYSSPSVTVQYFDGSSWVDASSAFTDMTADEWKEYSVSIPSTAQKIRFYGWYVKIDDIYGGKLLPVTPKPKLEVEGIANGGSLSWGNSDVSAGTTKTITLKNDGTADLAVTIAATDDYTIDPASATIEAGGTVVVTIGTPAHDGNGVLTITPSEGSGLSPYTINLTSYYKEPKPVMSIDKTSIAFGKVNEVKSETITVSNTGDADLVVTIANDNTENFSVEPADQLIVAPGEEGTITITYNYADGIWGTFNANVKVTPNYGGTYDVKTIAVSATSKDPNVWDEDFESGVLDQDWIASGWSISTPGSYSGGNGTKMVGGNSRTATLITPRLIATEGQQLTFELGGSSSSYPLAVEYSTDRESWTEVASFTEDGTCSIDAPVTDPTTFYLRFTGWVYIDNLNGFKLDKPAHDAAITAVNIPATGAQFVEYTAAVTVKEMAGKDENAKVEFYFGETKMGETEGTLDPNGEETFEVKFTPEEAFEGEAHFKVTFISDDDEVFATFDSDPVAVNIAAATVFDETTEILVDETGNKASVVVKYTPKAGWNTIALPFALTNDILTQIFGEGWKAYEFNGYKDGALSFKPATMFAAGYPYVVYSAAPVASENGYVVNNVNVSAAQAKADSYGGATFQATYTPIAAPDMAGKYGVVPSTGKIQKGSDKASLKSLRGYFELPASAPANVNAIFFEEDGTITSINAVELQNEINGNLYDLSGRKVEGKAKAGVYIQNGKKVVVK